LTFADFLDNNFLYNFPNELVHVAFDSTLEEL